jgi:hypothetical protein
VNVGITVVQTIVCSSLKFRFMYCVRKGLNRQSFLCSRFLTCLPQKLMYLHRSELNVGQDLLALFNTTRIKGANKNKKYD